MTYEMMRWYNIFTPFSLHFIILFLFPVVWYDDWWWVKDVMGWWLMIDMSEDDSRDEMIFLEDDWMRSRTYDGGGWLMMRMMTGLWMTWYVGGGDSMIVVGWYEMRICDKRGWER